MFTSICNEINQSNDSTGAPNHSVGRFLLMKRRASPSTPPAALTSQFHSQREMRLIHHQHRSLLVRTRSYSFVSTSVFPLYCSFYITVWEISYERPMLNSPSFILSIGFWCFSIAIFNSITLSSSNAATWFVLKRLQQVTFLFD